MKEISSGARGSKLVRESTSDAAIGSSENSTNPMTKGATKSHPVSDSDRAKPPARGPAGGGSAGTRPDVRSAAASVVIVIVGPAPCDRRTRYAPETGGGTVPGAGGGASALVEDSLEGLDVLVKLGLEVEIGRRPQPAAEVLVGRVGLFEVRHRGLVARGVRVLEHRLRDAPVDLEGGPA